MNIEIKDVRELTMDEKVTHTKVVSSIGSLGSSHFQLLSDLPIVNQELRALLYGGSPRDKVIFAINHPEKFLATLSSFSDMVSQMLDTIKRLANQFSIPLPKIPDAEVKCLDDANIQEFYNFSRDDLGIVDECYAFTFSNGKAICNPVANIPYSVTLLTHMKQDLLVTITLCEEYVYKFPDIYARNEYIQHHFINTSYE